MKVFIEIRFSDKLAKNLEKEDENPEKFVGQLVHVYRREVDKMIVPLKAIDPKVKCRVYAGD
jgi:hypothetical protein